MKLAWLTDIHLNFIDKNARQIFYQEIVNIRCDSVLITGDIAEAPSLADILDEMADYVKSPIYFVLGNHDYYRGRITHVRNTIAVMTKNQNNLFWLPASGLQQLDGDTVLIGQDGWADGRLGDYHNSRLVLNDCRMIADLFQEKIRGKAHLLEKMQQLADADAVQLKNNLLQAVGQNPKKVIVLTHIPPFKEACLYKGKISDDNGLPYFSSKVMGEELMKIAQEKLEIEFLVLCGHTHSKAKYQPIHNLIIEVGGAEYGKPEIQKILYV